MQTSVGVMEVHLQHITAVAVLILYEWANVIATELPILVYCRHVPFGWFKFF